MAEKAASLGWARDDKACICSNERYGNGMIACSHENCPPSTNLMEFGKFAMQYCGKAKDVQHSFSSTISLQIARFSDWGPNGPNGPNRPTSNVTSSSNVPVSKLDHTIASLNGTIQTGIYLYFRRFTNTHIITSIRDEHC